MTSNMTKVIKNNFYPNKLKNFKKSKKANLPSLAFRLTMKPSLKENKRKKLHCDILNTNLLENLQKRIPKYLKTKTIGREGNPNQNKVGTNQSSTTSEDS
jgi:hypothetical protein